VSDLIARVAIKKATIKRVQLSGKKITVLMVAEADTADAIYSDLVRLSDGTTKADVVLTAQEEDKNWSIPESKG